ncbi:unnamed protein product [Thelazia callipaeda]|uniref:Apple domain-containing protein n=1 Tax=Thelazia callipaeda TaxID=103827 RepID=A0A0N5CP15_THECL|nr:unnamed protein product [Thelazia callipaeda]
MMARLVWMGHSSIWPLPRNGHFGICSAIEQSSSTAPNVGICYIWEYSPEVEDCINWCSPMTNACTEKYIIAENSCVGKEPTHMRHGGYFPGRSAGDMK